MHCPLTYNPYKIVKFGLIIYIYIRIWYVDIRLQLFIHSISRNNGVLLWSVEVGFG